MGLAVDLLKLFDEFDNELNKIVGKPTADMMRATIREKYYNFRTDEESKLEKEQLAKTINIPGNGDQLS